MAPRMYLLAWILAVVSAGVFYKVGMGDVARIVFGFIFTTLFFGFFVAFLPWWIDQIHQPKTKTK